MWIYVWDNEIKGIYLWDTPVKEVYLWDTKIRPVGMYIDFLLIAWGWGWGWYASSPFCLWGWGWAWGVINCESYMIQQGNYTVMIWAGGAWQGYRTPWCNGGDSVFDTFTAYWWWWGWWRWAAKAGGSWGGWSYGSYYSAGWAGCTWQWNNGGSWVTNYWGWGWGWYWAVGWNAYYESNYFWGTWWIGILTCITWKEECFAWGWGWGWRGSPWIWQYGWGCGGWSNRSATTCGSWGGGNPWTWGWWNWACGVFIVRYPSSAWYNITWGTKYLCNWYCIHCFTSNWTLTVN